MHSAGRRQFLRLTTAVVTSAFVFPSLAMAQNSAVDKFLADPAKALQQYPKGGAQLISLIRDVALAHPEALSTIVGLLKDANVDQQSAIGSGLGQAAQIVVKTNPNYATQIQQAIASACSGQNSQICPAAAESFAAVTGNVAIAANGGGGGGPGGGGGGGGGAGGGGGGGVTLGGGLPTGGPNSGGGPPGSFHYQTFGSNPFTGGGGVGGGGSTSPH